MHLPSTLRLTAPLLITVLVMLSIVIPRGTAEATTKWFPGHYLRTHADSPYTNAESFLKLANTTGLKVDIRWDAVESSKGVYNFSKIDQLLSLARQHGKKIILKVSDREFGSNPAGTMPAYVAQEGCVFTMEQKGGALRWWDPKCVDLRINLLKALSKYDCDIAFAGIIVAGESAIAGRQNDSGYSDQAYLTQYLRALKEVKAVFPNTPVFIGFNFMSGDGLSQVATELDRLGGSGFTHPDTAPDHMFGDATEIEISYHGRVPTLANFELASTQESDTNLEIIRWAANSIGASFYGWNHYRPNYTSYMGDVLAFMTTNEARDLAQKNAACPSRLAPCVTTLSSCSSTYTPPPLTPVTPVSATCQNLQTPTTSIPTGYGAAYNPLSSTKEYLVSAACTSATQATVTVGNGNQTTYVYNKGYYYTGTTWQQFTLSCSNLVSNLWCVGRGTVTIPTPQNPTNVIGYTCQYLNNTWKCGCRDSACNARFWQLQRVGR